MRLCTAILSLSLFAAVPAGSLPARAQAQDQLYTASRLQLDVTKVLVAQENAWNKGDLDSFLSHYKDDPATEAILSGPVRGTQNIHSAFHVQYPSRDAMGQLENSEVQVRALGENFALATGKYHLTRGRKAGGDAEGTFLSILEKTAQGWQIIFSDNT